MNKYILMLAAVFFAAGTFAYENYSAAIKDGHSLRGKRKFQEAKKAYQQAQKLAKNDNQKFSAIFLEGVATAESGKFEEGIEVLRKAVEADKHPLNRLTAQFHVGYYYGVLKRYEQAIPEMEKVAVEAKGTNHLYVDRAKVCIGQYLLKLRKNAEAVKAAQTAVNSKYKDVAVLAYAVIYEAQMQLKDKKAAAEAVDAAQKVEGVTPNGFFTARRIGWDLNIRLGKTEEALKIALEIRENTKLIAYYRHHGDYYAALTYRKMKNKAEEIACWERLTKCGIAGFEKRAAQQLASIKK